MTNSNPFAGANSLFDLLEGAVTFAGRNLADETSVSKTGPKYRKASELGIGTEVVKADGSSVWVDNLARAGDDGTIEVVFSDGDNYVLWPNMAVEVK